ncbi:hypothetical protein CCMSSC00406_0000547 [Pleurotus cornucopiae]|uniref:Uncharacterized protein n=1 Tax=Pleurotus cornucopiae TaxID=5321 RepID=A0ACB7JB96_PLECO|nr:hypothetical protein CCMSSC00406_0000547 [Pleurotus cornucopiae]
MAYIEEEPEDIYEARDVEDTLDAVPLGHISFDNPLKDNDPPCRTTLGIAELISFYTTACELRLNTTGDLNLPGDEDLHPLSSFWDEFRFAITQISDDEVVVEDCRCEGGFDHLPLAKLLNPKFEFMHWLAT